MNLLVRHAYDVTVIRIGDGYFVKQFVGPERLGVNFIGESNQVGNDICDPLVVLQFTSGLRV